MTTILFVDDDRDVLDGMRRRFRRARSDWELAFAGGGQEALDLLGHEPVDVIVSDIRMPGVDGIALLQRVRETHPDIARIVLTGYAEPAQERAAFAVCHRFLPKPCDPDVLVATIDQACQVRALLTDGTIRGLVGSLERLPSLPSVFMRVRAQLDDDRSDAASVAGVIEEDTVLAATVLRAANSALFAPANPIQRVRDAVSYLGRRMIGHIVLGATSVDQFAKLGVPSYFLRGFQAHSAATADLAGRLVPKGARDDAFAAGLLHDIGQLVLMVTLGDRYEEIVDAAHEKRKPLVEVELEALGATHDQVGAYLLGLWGLPWSIIAAVAGHHGGGALSAAPVDAATARAARIAELVTATKAGKAVHHGAFEELDLTREERVTIERWRASFRGGI
ncbi:MAG: HDOD domain-containing protein [Myxococcales bacterium]|nr:HDOD domain-containing protein [Myxococcales bacterium]MCB9735612.1 HDOD domain-containing protein [Deltaproteobacteria bacterium]